MWQFLSLVYKIPGNFNISYQYRVENEMLYIKI